MSNRRIYFFLFIITIFIFLSLSIYYYAYLFFQEDLNVYLYPSREVFPLGEKINLLVFADKNIHGTLKYSISYFSRFGFFRDFAKKVQMLNGVGDIELEVPFKEELTYAILKLELNSKNKTVILTKKFPCVLRNKVKDYFFPQSVFAGDVLRCKFSFFRQAAEDIEVKLLYGDKEVYTQKLDLKDKKWFFSYKLPLKGFNDKQWHFILQDKFGVLWEKRFKLNSAVEKYFRTILYKKKDKYGLKLQFYPSFFSLFNNFKVVLLSEDKKVIFEEKFSLKKEVDFDFNLPLSPRNRSVYLILVAYRFGEKPKIFKKTLYLDPIKLKIISFSDFLLPDFYNYVFCYWEDINKKKVLDIPTNFNFPVEKEGNFYKLKLLPNKNQKEVLVTALSKKEGKISTYTLPVNKESDAIIMSSSLWAKRGGTISYYVVGVDFPVYFFIENDKDKKILFCKQFSSPGKIEITVPKDEKSNFYIAKIFKRLSSKDFIIKTLRIPIVSKIPQTEKIHVKLEEEKGSYKSLNVSKEYGIYKLQQSYRFTFIIKTFLIILYILLLILTIYFTYSEKVFINNIYFLVHSWLTLLVFYFYAFSTEKYLQIIYLFFVIFYFLSFSFYMEKVQEKYKKHYFIIYLLVIFSWVLIFIHALNIYLYYIIFFFLTFLFYYLLRFVRKLAFTFLFLGIVSAIIISYRSFVIDIIPGSALFDIFSKPLFVDYSFPVNFKGKNISFIKRNQVDSQHKGVVFSLFSPDLFLADSYFYLPIKYYSSSSSLYGVNVALPSNWEFLYTQGLEYWDVYLPSQQLIEDHLYFKIPKKQFNISFLGIQIDDKKDEKKVVVYPASNLLFNYVFSKTDNKKAFLESLLQLWYDYFFSGKFIFSLAENNTFIKMEYYFLKKIISFPLPEKLEFQDPNSQGTIYISLKDLHKRLDFLKKKSLLWDDLEKSPIVEKQVLSSNADVIFQKIYNSILNDDLSMFLSYLNLIDEKFLRYRIAYKSVWSVLPVLNKKEFFWSMGENSLVLKCKFDEKNDFQKKIIEFYLPWGIEPDYENTADEFQYSRRFFSFSIAKGTSKTYIFKVFQGIKTGFFPVKIKTIFSDGSTRVDYYSVNKVIENSLNDFWKEFRDTIKREIEF